MNFQDLLPILAGVGIPVGVIAVVAYLLLLPDKAEKVAGWLWTPIAKVFKNADKTKVAFKVQGEVNTARAALLKNAPDG